VSDVQHSAAQHFEDVLQVSLVDSTAPNSDFPFLSSAQSLHLKGYSLQIMTMLSVFFFFGWLSGMP